ncbi:hypothetical protein [Bernardetia sp.]|uniref:hypothetical protein n=1 Tax=Bernardetia sp. TaxID=1937974 RepID=UPI0025C1F173|nr:hypothetical protein [Bernardetia sp.]
MYKVTETDSFLKVKSKMAIGLVWTGFFIIALLVSFYMGFEYISLKCERNLQAKSGKRSKLTPKNRCYIVHFDFKNGFTTDSLLLSDIIRMDKGYFSSLEDNSDMTVHYNPTFVTSQQTRYPLRKISSVAFTPELLSKNFNNFITNNHPSLSTWDWYMGYWGVVSGFSFLALLFLAVSGRYQIVTFDKKNQTFQIKNYGMFGVEEEEGKWKNIKRIIYQNKETRHKKGIFFLMKEKKNPLSKKYRIKKVYFTRHTDKASKKVAQRIADLVRPIARPNSPKNKEIVKE